MDRQSFFEAYCERLAREALEINIETAEEFLDEYWYLLKGYASDLIGDDLETATAIFKDIASE